MANVSTFSLVVPITGDNAATSCVINLGYTPATAMATAAYDATGNSVLANISSVVPGTMQVTINFAAAFSGTVQVVLALSSSTYSTAQAPPIAPPTLTKGAQGSTGFSVQELKDAGRNYIVLYAQLIAGVTTEALATFTKNVAGTATTGQTAYTVTNGKTFRIEAISVAIKNTTTVANSCTYNVRAAASVAASSPLVASLGCSSVGAVAGQQGFASLPLPDGIEIAGNGSIQIGVSHLENVTTASISSFTLIGYEY